MECGSYIFSDHQVAIVNLIPLEDRADSLLVYSSELDGRVYL